MGAAGCDEESGRQREQIGSGDSEGPRKLDLPHGLGRGADSATLPQWWPRPRSLKRMLSGHKRYVLALDTRAWGSSPELALPWPFLTAPKHGKSWAQGQSGAVLAGDPFSSCRPCPRLERPLPNLPQLLYTRVWGAHVCVVWRGRRTPLGHSGWVGCGGKLFSLPLVSPTEALEAWTGWSQDPTGVDLLSRVRTPLPRASDFSKLWELGRLCVIPSNPKLSRVEQGGGALVLPLSESGVSG